MLNKLRFKNRMKLVLIVSLACCGISFSQVSLAEISTLFTTVQERQLINANRYRSNSGEVLRPIERTDEQPQQSIQALLKEEVTQTFTISGISISEGGVNTVWINSQAYEDGEKLEDDSRIRVITGNDIKVRITAPDGKHYYGTSGETVEVTYLATVEN